MHKTMHKAQLDSVRCQMGYLRELQVSLKSGCKSWIPLRASTRPAVEIATTDLALPRNVSSMVEQAAAAVTRSQETGQNRHILQLLNPVNEKAVNFMATEALDYPCSNMKEFETIVDVTKRLIQGLSSEATELRAKRIDEGGIDGDLCAVVSGKEVTAVVWPTAEKLKLLKEYAQELSGDQTLLVVNPLWKTEGNLVSEFGIGPWRRANEEFVASFETSYMLYEQRIGAPSSINMSSGTRYDNGGVVRVLRAYPSGWQVFILAENGTSQAIGQFPSRPSYSQLEEMINRARQAKMEIFRVAKQASSVYATQNDELTEREFYSEDEILTMDAQKLKRVLIRLGLPSAGVLPKLQKRALAVCEGVQSGKTLEEAVEAAKKLR